MGRRSLLLAGAALPASAYAQCVTGVPAVDACRGGVRVTGSTLPPGASLDLNFMFPGTLDPRITFTRASTATYTDATGTIQTAAVNAPRWDYDPVTHALRGVLIEEQRTNIWLQSADANNAAWNKASAGGPVTPVTTANQTIAPDGTLTAASVVYPAVNVANSYSVLYQGLTTAAQSYAFSVWLRGSVGGEQVYVGQLAGGGTLCLLTTQWKRFSFLTPVLSAGTNYFTVGTDLRGGQGVTPAQTIYAWGAQVEQGAFPTSYIPTTLAAVTRAADSCAILPVNMSPWFAPPGGSWMAEFINLNTSMAGYNARLIGQYGGIPTQLFEVPYLALSQYDGAGPNTGNSVIPGAISKGAASYVPGTGKVCLNGGTVASGAMTTGFAACATAGVGLMGDNTSATDIMTGYIRRVSYWPRALSDTEMQQVTT